MEEEIIIEQEYIDMAKAEMEKDPALKACKVCFHFDPEKNWCHYYRIPKMHYNYGANCFLTNEQALRALAIQERKRANIQRAKFFEKLDVMNIMVSGADMIREDIFDMLTKEYERLDIKAPGDDEAYKRSKKNLDRLAKCYSKMKFLLQDFESEYRTFVGYWNAQMFANEKGVYSPEFDKHTHNVGFMTYSFFALHSTMFMCEENVEAFKDFINNLQKKRESPLEQEDLKRYLIKI